ncbi:MAG: helix-turn-helix domain-containing protein [Anaeromyxobacter sp.]|nr:helix-turn-helix domain-containing protein [Anaeromyxobacter sp.]
MSERLRFVLAQRKNRSTFSSLCAAFGVAPKTGYKWLHQFEASGAAGLVDRPAGPSRIAGPSPRPCAIAWSSCVASTRPGARSSSRGSRRTRSASMCRPQHGRRTAEAARARDGAQANTPQSLGATSHADKPKQSGRWTQGWFRLGDGVRCDR